jgi:3-oxoadipate enol-lactonase
MGGYIAFELWRTARSRIDALVLANTRAEADDEQGVARRRAVAERLTQEGSGFLVDQPPPLLSDGASEDLRAFVRGMIADQPASAIAAGALGMAERPASVADLPGIEVPTLVITGSEDTLIPPEITAPIAEAVPGAELVRIEGAGHLSNLEQPSAFDTALDGLLAGLAR